MKKKVNIVLIVVIVVVYGGIAYKYFRNATPQEQMITATPTGNELLIPENIREQEKVFILNLSNRDPFLDKKHTIRSNTRSIPSIPTKTKKLKTRKMPIDMNWPTITYLGFSKSNNQTKRTAVLRIDGKLYRKREGGMIDKMKIIKIANDSVYIGLNKKDKRYFLKKTTIK